MNSLLQRIKAFVFGKESGYAFATITLIIAVIPEGFFKCLKQIKCLSFCKEWSDIALIIIGRVILCCGIFLVVKILFNIWYKNRTEVEIKGLNYKIVVEYGDITSITEGKRVIHFDECFTTIVGKAPGDIKSDSVCGQYLLKNPDINVPALIEQAGITPLKGKSKYNNNTKYESGILVPNGDDLLMAFAKLDKNGRADMTYEEYLKTLDKLWGEIDRYHGTEDVYVPILGSLITHFDKDLTQQQLLDIMISSYRLHDRKLKIPNRLHIVCKEREGFSLNNAFGVE
ncbi:macro domain-containing protein [Oribacterium sp. FC2011]|uniref:macro domain-containing protein n=1 Tax=Oribacterium sp. FC2011 TaxID=1408311 RepID=UPI0004E10820|nr:macro domain-containing protein [Oribacterium sp. FC2011]